MTKSGAPGEERSSSGGFGVAAGMIAAALVALWAPTYLGWSGWSETAWHVAGGILGTIGMGGGLLELSQLQGRRGYDDWGVGAVFIGLAGVVFTVETASGVGGAPRTGLRLVVVCFLIVAGFGFGMGVGNFLTAPRANDGAEKDRAPRVSQWVAVLTALVGLSTAILNFLAAR